MPGMWRVNLDVLRQYEHHAIDDCACLGCETGEALGLPDWGRGVTVPISIKPKPSGKCLDMLAVLVPNRQPRTYRIGKFSPMARFAGRGSK